MNGLGFACRQLLEHLGSTTVTVFTLALGSLAVAEDRSHAPFAIEQQNESYWLVRPNGERFFSLGVCCVNRGVSREEYDTANPGYAAWRRATLRSAKFGDRLRNPQISGHRILAQG